MSNPHEREIQPRASDLPADYRRALEESEARFRNLIEHNADGVLVVDPQGTIRFLNPAAETVLGRPAEELLGEAFGIPITPGSTTEIEIPRADSGTHLAEMRVMQTVWEGETAYVATLRDITERKRQREALQFLASAGAELARSLDLPTTLQTIARLATQRLADWCVVDFHDGESLWRQTAVASAAESQPWQRELVKLSGKTLLPLAQWQQRTANLAQGKEGCEWVQCTAGTPAEAEVLHQLPCRHVFQRTLATGERTFGLMTLGVFRPGSIEDDISHALTDSFAGRAALALDNASMYQTIKESVAYRDEFLAMLAHELRNPLQGIDSAAQVFEHHLPDDHELRETLELLNGQTNHLGRLLDDLLDLSRIVHGKISLDKQETALQKVIREVELSMRPRMQAAQQHFEVQYPETSLRLYIDPARMQQVIVNLLSNASKYSPAGAKIRLEVLRRAEHVCIAVSDTGQGLSEEMKGKIFEPFVQMPATLDRSRGGLGIGLTMVRKLVELHQGTISVESAGLNRGSRFEVSLPLPAQTSAAPKPVAPAESHPTEEGKFRVALVEDHPTNRQLLQKLLETIGHTVFVAEDGPAGLELIQRERPHFALVDIGLPGLDGYEVAQRLTMLAECSHVVLVAVSGYGQPEDRQHALEAGFHEHLTKPIKLIQVRELFQRHAGSFPA